MWMDDCRAAFPRRAKDAWMRIPFPAFTAPR